MKKWILAAVILVIAGTVISLVAAAAMDFDLSRLDSGNYETNTYAVNEPFSAVAVDAEDEDVLILPSEDGACRVVCLEAWPQTMSPRPWCPRDRLSMVWQ